MKKFMKNLKEICIGGGIAFISILSLSLISCGEDSGLGSSVDTEAPGVEITYPASLSVIRESFVFGGKWTDDKSVKSISVEVFRTNSDESKTRVYKTNATINSKNTWQTTLNEYDAEKYASSNGWQFCDGDYEIQVTAYDNAGHSSSTISRAFSIDNTPPVLVLTKPTSFGANAAKTYGRTVQLEGTFSENCSSGISNLIVSFYNSKGEKLFDSEFSGITDMSNANPLIIAQYYDESEEPDSTSSDYKKWENYKKIFTESNISSYRNEGADITEQLYFSITASDAAKIYNDFENNTSIPGGNVSTSFYRGTTEMLNLINKKNSNFSDFSVAALKNYINKTDTKYLENETLKSIVESALSVSTNTSETEDISSSITNITTKADDNTKQDVYLNFSVNPKNNPNYTISGFALKSASDTAGNENYTDGYNNYNADSPINISIVPGLDLTNILKSSVSIYYYEVTDFAPEKKLLWTWNEGKAVEYAVKGGMSESEAKSAVEVDPATYRYEATKADENIDSLSKSTTLSAASGEITYGKKYKFEIEGKDINGQKIIASDSNGFGFYAKSNSSVPTIVVGSAENYKNMANLSALKESVITGGTFGFGGTVSSSDEFNASGNMSYIIKLKDSATSETIEPDSIAISYSKDAEKSTADNNVYNWDFDLSSTSGMNSLLSNGNGLYILEILISASNGGGTTTTNRTYYIDNAVPSLKNISLASETSGTSTYAAKKDGYEGMFYLNNSSGNKFKISGMLMDNYSIDSVSCKITDEAGNELNPGSSTSDSWTFENIDLSSLTKNAVIELTARDKAGNENSVKYYITLDTAAPKGKHQYDKKKKDLIFRVGEANNELDELSGWDSQIIALDSTLDKDVGGKYSAGTWGTSQTITIRGDWEEEGSGVKMIYYKVYDSEPTENEISDFTKNYATDKTGYFAPLETSESRRVSYTNASGSKLFSTVTSSFKTTISGLTNENNYLLLVAVDNVGNAGIDTLNATDINSTDETPEESTEWNNSHSSFSLNVDTEAPTLTSTTSGAHYTNGVKPITVEGDFDDNASGVILVSLKLNGQTIKVESEDLDTTNKKWTITIPATILSQLESSKVYNVQATATDLAGHSTPLTIFTLQVDKESPKIRMTSPTLDSNINGTISVSGSVPAANIGATPEKLELYYTTTEPSSSTTISDLTQIGNAIDDVTQIYSWSFSDFDTESAFTSDESALVTKDIYLVPVVYDEAGNCNIYTEASNGTKTYSFSEGNGTASNTGNYFKYTVDRNADRPIIQITSIESLGENAWLGSATIRGTVTDDDGTIKSFSISQNGSNWTGVTVSNGSWSYSITGGDAANIPLYFKVVDAAGKTFTTGEESPFARPYYLLANTQKTDYETGDYGLDNSTAISINLDTAVPKVETRGLAIGTHTGDYDSDTNSQGLYTLAQIKAEPTAALYIPGTSRYAGGSSKYIRFFIPVNESNIDKVSVKILDSDANAETKNYYEVASDGTETEISSDEIVLSATSQTITVSGTEYTYYESAIIRIPAQNVVTENGEQVEKTSGTKTISVSVSDKAGNVTTKTDSFAIDNFGPAQITITSPASTDEVTGTVNVVGTASDAGVGISSIEWLVPPKAYTESMPDSDLSALEGWTNSNNTKTTSVFNFKFTAGSTTDLTEYDNTSKYKVAHNATTNIYTIPIFIKTTDTLGNVYIKRDYAITHNPDADRPVTEFSYPTANDYESGNDYITLSGVIRASGTVAIPSGTTNVGQVYIQIGTVAANGDVTWTKDNATLSSEFTSLGGVKTKEQIVSEYNLSAVNADEITSKFYIADDWWGIPVTTKTSTWNVSLNAKGNLDPSGDSTNNIAIRACAINADGKMGLWTDTTINPVYIHVDNGAPSQSAVMRQYTSFNSSALESNIKVQKDYIAEMYLKGTWYLVVTLMDTESVNPDSITVRRGSAAQAYESSSVKWTYSDSSTSTGEKPESGKTVTKSEKVIYIPIETESMASSNVSYTVYVEDGSTPAHSSTMTYTFYIDNTAPQISSVFKGSSLAEDESNKITAGSEIADSDYIYTLGGKVDETGSGFDKVVFYYVRDTGFTTPAILDPFVTTGQDSAKAVIATDGLTTVNVADNENLKLYGKELTSGTTAVVDASAGKYTFTHSGVSGNEHIRTGGLIYVGGDFGVITEISGTTVSFKSNASVSESTSATAFFPYAQVVDNTGIEKTNKTSGTDFEFESGDDGDGMPETISGSKATGFTWTGIMHTTNIPDGPVNLVVLAFDVAGNVGISTTKVNIVNNAPRLAKLYLGTDLNASGTWSSNEFVGYNINTSFAENIVANKELTTNGFKIKKDLAVAAEIVGGNDSIIMVYKKAATDSTAVTKNNGTAGASATLSEYVTGQLGEVSVNGINKSSALYGFTITSADVAASSEEDSTMGASFTFWDKTQETVQGETSQNCVVWAKDFYVDLVDATPPKVVINPFYWVDSSHNSLYSNSSANGHIELENDWKNAPGYTSSVTSGEYDADPKVSGKITFTGTAYDDRVLKNLSFTLANSAGTAYSGFSSITMATYDPTSYSANGGWSALSGNSGATLANGGKYEWTISTTESDASRNYADDCYLEQKGHKIYWTVSIDTAQISGVAATDVKLTVTANDTVKSSSESTATSETPSESYLDAKDNHVPSYKMDVVPYITKLYTQISDNAGEEFARSATGRYSVNSAETFRLYGFNLNRTSTTVTFTPDSGTAATLDVSQGGTDDDGTYINVKAAKATKSGSLSATVGSVVSLNNKNANPTFATNTDDTITAYPYNSQANGVTNNRLDDDVKIYLWGTSVFDSVMNTYKANVTSPMMKFDPSGNYYISYGQGATLFAIDKNASDTTLEMCYNKYHNTNVAYDSSGNIYGVATNTDRISTSRTSATSFTFFSRKLGIMTEVSAGTNNNNHNYGNYSNGTNKRRLELSQYGGNNGTYNINRVQRPKLIVSGDSSEAKVYMAYYDASANNIKFRYGTVTGTDDYTTKTTGYGQNQTTTYTRNGKMTGGIANDLQGNETDTGDGASSATGYHIIANESTTYKGGAYTAVGYTSTSNGVAVVAWYDASKRQLVYSYNENPATVDSNGTTWQKNAVVIDDSYAGWYVDLAVDSNDGIHIAYYKSSSGDLKYAYIPAYNKASKAKVVTVDSYLSVGTNITINTKGTVPYIYYYNTSANQTTNSIKVAWQNDTTTLRDGALNDKFTGAWESMTIPTSNIPNDAIVSGGVPTAGTYSGEVVLGYMTDVYFEKAELK